MFERSKKYLAGGVSSGIRLAEKPMPMFFERGEGSKIYDVDGNEYIDYLLGQGPLILGHNPPKVIEAIKEQLDKGLIFGAQHELEIELSKKLQRVVPCAELVRYNNTGSEAVHAAFRLARGYTGRNKIVRFEGHYHGWFDDILISSHPSLEQAGPREAPHAVLGSGGQRESVLGDVIVLPWNDLDLFKRTVEQRQEEIAGVITEPIMCNCGGLMPREGYLEGVREICTQHGIVLIFDEVITGFRYALGGAQEYLGITPDLATFAKGIAAGLPLSCVAGKQAIMGLIAEGKVMHAGTYNSNPIVIAAAWAALNELEKDDRQVYKHLFAVGTQLAEGIRSILDERGIPSIVQETGPAFHISFTEHEKFFDYRDTLDRDEETYHKFAAALSDRGVRVKTAGLWFLSAAHTQEDIDVTLEAVNGAVDQVFG
jgi:glutamate-1-semialdehyde 2,1-aminomutase